MLKKWYVLGALFVCSFSIIYIIFLLQQESYSKINNIQIEQLKSAENIEILDVKVNNEYEKPFAYVFYKRGTTLGACTLRVINKRLDYHMDLMINEDPSNPVQVFGVRTGFPYQMIQINDNKLLQEGSYIYATFNQRKWHRLKIKAPKRSYIISGDYDEGSTGSSSVEIYNKKNQQIFDNR
ncbi:hypothetical protein ACL02P_17245 [Paenibacillus sp. MB22_1]|uniref:hypothetical protein n=1 Tax=Paenibacillus sp. MB22_1 TaxID=3383121 RepID=UPI00399FF10D